MKLAPIDIIIVVAYIGVVLYIAARSHHFAGKSLENYFLAGRNMPGWMTGISYAASMVSADAAVGYGGLAVATGLYVSWIYLSRFGIALFVGAMLFAVYWRRLNTFTTLEFYELRFEGLPGTLMRAWLAFRSSLIAMVAWTGISLLALVKISEPVLGWSKTETLALAIPLSVFYVWFSGYLGVVLSNLVQVLILDDRAPRFLPGRFCGLPEDRTTLRSNLRHWRLPRFRFFRRRMTRFSPRLRALHGWWGPASDTEAMQLLWAEPWKVSAFSRPAHPMKPARCTLSVRLRCSPWYGCSAFPVSRPPFFGRSFETASGIGNWRTDC